MVCFAMILQWTAWLVRTRWLAFYVHSSKSVGLHLEIFSNRAKFLIRSKAGSAVLLLYVFIPSVQRGGGGGGLRDEPKERLRGKAKTVVDSFVSSGVSIGQCHLCLFNLLYC